MPFPSIFKGKTLEEEPQVSQQPPINPSVKISKDSIFFDWAYCLQYLTSESNVEEATQSYFLSLLRQNLDQLFPNNRDYTFGAGVEVKKSKNCSALLRTAQYAKTIFVCLEKPLIKSVPSTRPKKIAKPGYNEWVRDFAQNWAKFDPEKAKEFLSDSKAQASKYRETHDGQEAFDNINEPYDRQFLVVEGVYFFNVAEDLRQKFAESNRRSDWQISLEIEILANKNHNSAYAEACMSICKQIAETSGEIKRLSEYAGPAVLENNDVTALIAKELGAKRGLEEFAKALGAVQEAALNAAKDLEGKTQDHAARRIAETSQEIAAKIGK